MRDLAGEGRLGLLGTIVDKAGGEKERLGGLVMVAAHGATTHQQRGGAERAIGQGFRHDKPCEHGWVSGPMTG
jgi:hypothetical protein